MMYINGYMNISLESLKRWANTLSIEKITRLECYGEDDIFDRSIDDFIADYSDELHISIKKNEKITTLGDLYTAYKHDKFNEYSKELKALFERLNIDKY